MELTLDDILRALPHRPPFLLLDGVHRLEPGLRIHASKTLQADSPWFSGHFPDLPVFPGVLIIEAMAQAGAVLAAYSVEGIDKDRNLPYLVNIEQGRLRKPVLPGQTLDLRVKRTHGWGNFWRLEGQAHVGADLVASATLMAALLPRAQPVQAPVALGGVNV